MRESLVGSVPLDGKEDPKVHIFHLLFFSDKDLLVFHCYSSIPKRPYYHYCTIISCLVLLVSPSRTAVLPFWESDRSEITGEPILAGWPSARFWPRTEAWKRASEPRQSYRVTLLRIPSTGRTSDGGGSLGVPSKIQPTDPSAHLVVKETERE